MNMEVLSHNNKQSNNIIQKLISENWYNKNNLKNKEINKKITQKTIFILLWICHNIKWAKISIKILQWLVILVKIHLSIKSIITFPINQLVKILDLQIFQIWILHNKIMETEWILYNKIWIEWCNLIKVYMGNFQIILVTQLDHTLEWIKCIYLHNSEIKCHLICHLQEEFHTWYQVIQILLEWITCQEDLFHQVIKTKIRLP